MSSFCHIHRLPALRRAGRAWAVWAGLLCAAGAIASAAVIWTETERFDDVGGWSQDAQFVDQMGSPYLLAAGWNGPVANAKTRVDVPHGGNYRLWARTRDWMPAQSPGAFAVLVNGKASRALGISKKPGWVWEDAGSFYLNAGPATVELKDLTGWYGRCDALVLADGAWTPPETPQALLDERIARGGLSAEVETPPPYDLVVVGGGMGGSCAAIVAARAGLRVALVQNRPVLGGNSSSEIKVGSAGDRVDDALDPGGTGLRDEIRGKPGGASKILGDLAAKEPNLTVYLDTHAVSVQMADRRRIEAVYAFNVRTGQRLRLRGKFFVDSTGDGNIAALAGAQYRQGREARGEYNESMAPETADKLTLCSSLGYEGLKTGSPVKYKGVPWAHKFRAPTDFGPGRVPRPQKGEWWLEYGGTRDTVAEAEEIRDELLRIIYGMWDYLKNYDPEKKSADYALAWVGHIVGKRESRRVIGDYVLNQNDLQALRVFDDQVAYGAFPIDLHPSEGIFSDQPPSNAVRLGGMFTIPLRSLYARDVDNLFLVGRCISASHVAHGASRVQATNGLEGEAVGEAAALCVRYGETPRQLVQNRIAQLQQQLLKNGAYLVDLPNADPGDLARTASVSASSCANEEDYFVPQEEGGSFLEMNTPRVVFFTVQGERLDGVDLWLRNRGKNDAAVSAKLLNTGGGFDLAAPRSMATAHAKVAPWKTGWVPFSLKARLKPGEVYALELESAENVRWGLFSQQPEGTARAYRVKDRWSVQRDSAHAFRLEPHAPLRMASMPRPPKGAPLSEMFAAQNAVNGFARAVRGWPNAWKPGVDAPLPQWLQLDWSSPQTFNTVHISFQTRVLSAADYRLEARVDGQWREIARVQGNAERRNVLTFANVRADALRLVLEKAAPGAAVCEIRVYDEPVSSKPSNEQNT